MCATVLVAVCADVTSPQHLRLLVLVLLGAVIALLLMLALVTR
jgi:hypothetical protein